MTIGGAPGRADVPLRFQPGATILRLGETGPGRTAGMSDLAVHWAPIFAGPIPVHLVTYCELMVLPAQAVLIEEKPGQFLCARCLQRRAAKAGWSPRLAMEARRQSDDGGRSSTPTK